MAIALYNRQPKWSAEERKTVTDMFEDGYSDAQISAKINRTIKAIERQRSLMGLRRKANARNKVKFVIHDATVEFWPAWYKDYLKRQWESREQMSSR